MSIVQYHPHTIHILCNITTRWSNIVRDTIDHLRIPLALEGSHLLLLSCCICYRVSHCTLGVYMTKTIYILITQLCYLVFLFFMCFLGFLFFIYVSHRIALSDVCMC